MRFFAFREDSVLQVALQLGLTKPSELEESKRELAPEEQRAHGGSSPVLMSTTSIENEAPKN